MDGNEVKKREISPAIKDHFEVIKVVPGIVYYGDRKYDLTKIDLATAEYLHKRGFPYLKKKEAAKDVAKAGK